MTWPMRAAQARARPRDRDRRRGPFGVHLVDGGNKGEVGAGLRQLGEVVGFGTRIARKILARAELPRVDENRRDGALASRPRRRDERHMPGMQRTHRRHQANAVTGLAPRGDLPPQLADRPDHSYRFAVHDVTYSLVRADRLHRMARCYDSPRRHTQKKAGPYAPDRNVILGWSGRNDIVHAILSCDGAACVPMRTTPAFRDCHNGCAEVAVQAQSGAGAFLPLVGYPCDRFLPWYCLRRSPLAARLIFTSGSISAPVHWRRKAIFRPNTPGSTITIQTSTR